MPRITISGGGYTAVIMPERGANCIDLIHKESGARVLRTFEGGNPSNAFLFGMPILFPPNRIKGGKFTFDGREYSLPVNEVKTGCFLHGTLHETPFEVKEVCDNSVTLEYSATKDVPYLTYPHEFTFSICYTVDKNGLSQTVKITNNSSLTMPVGLAYHTTFNIPFVNGSEWSDITMMLPCGVEYDRDMSDYTMTWERVSDPTFHKAIAEGITPGEHTISRHFSRPKGASLRLLDSKSGYEVVYEASDSFKYWMVFNGGAKDYICVEPQTWINCAPHAPKEMGDVGIIKLLPNETETLVTRLSVSKRI